MVHQYLLWARDALASEAAAIGEVSAGLGADFVRGDFRLRFLAPHDARHRFVDKRYQHAGAARQRRDVGISEQAEGNVYGDF